MSRARAPRVFASVASLSIAALLACTPGPPEPDPSAINRWSFAGGAALTNLLVPDELDLNEDSALRLRAHVTGAEGCRLDVWLVPGDGASLERVRAPERRRLMPDLRVGSSSVPIDSADQGIDVSLRPGPGFHGDTAVVEAALACGGGGGQQAVVAGAARARDPLPARGRASIAQLAVVRVRPRPTAVRAEFGDVNVDGVLDDPVWRRADWHELQASLAGGRVLDPSLLTITAVAWDDANLYVGGRLRDRDIWTKFRERDDPLYRQEAFEVFLAGDNSGSRYIELQISARNVLFDAYFPTYRKGDEGRDFDIVGAVSLQGTLNRRKDEDRGWSVELAVPWSEICAVTEVQCPPSAGQTLRANVFRLEKADRKSQSGYALSPTRKPDFHAWENAAVVELAPRR